MNALFAYLVEKFFYSDYISADLYQNNVYSSSATITMGIALIITLFYYFGMDSARYSGFKTWIIMAGIAFLLVIIANYLYVDSALSYLSEGGYWSEYWQYAVVYGIFGLIFCMILSIFIKRFTKSLSRSPF